MPAVDNVLSYNADEDFEQVNHDELIAIAKKLCHAYYDCRAEKEKQHEQLKQILRATSFPSSVCSIELQPTWIRAELDSPGDTAFSCFGERSKYRNVLVYDRNGSSLEIRPKEALKNQLGVIYCRIPSRTTDAIHVFVECAPTVGNGSSRKFRVSTTDRIPIGFVPHCTIHFKRLRWTTRWKLWNGQIKWLFILRSPDTSIDTHSPEVREKPSLLPRN